MGYGLTYITSEPALPADEYLHVLENIFDIRIGSNYQVFAKLGIKNSLHRLAGHVYPIPKMVDFEWFLKHTRPIGISDGQDILCVAENFALDSYARYDWITADFSAAAVLSTETRNDFLGFVTWLTLYKSLRYSWDRYDD